MYTQYWKFKEKAFDNTPHPRFLYRSDYHTEAFSRLMYTINGRKGAAMLSGEYGSGKTLLTRALLKDLLREGDKYKMALIVNPSFSANDFLKEIIFQLEGIKFTKRNKFDLIHALNDILYKSMDENKNVVIIVDEAQIIRKKQTLEELRLLLNFQLNDKFLLTLILVGQPELIPKIESIPQLKQRLAITYHLKALPEEDVAKYVNYRCNVAGLEKPIFSEDAYKIIAEKSSGIPRKINTICELSLLQGMFEKKDLVTEDIVKKVAEDLRL